ncbi:hypothetical protein NBRC116493_24360 [Aurantivibrio infirmus]
MFGLFHTYRVFRAISILFIGIFFSLSANAHTDLHHSIPKANSELKSSPENLELGFAKKVRLLQLELSNSQNKSVDFNFKASSEAGEIFTYELPALENGVYTVDWSILGGDGHRISKSFNFTVNK